MIRGSENVKVKEGGTIRIGATGKVSALMMQELDSNIKTSSKKPVTGSQRIQTTPVSIGCGGSTKRLQRVMSLNGGSRSSINNNNNNNNARDEITPRKKKNTKHAIQQIPMLDSEDLWIDKTPIRVGEHKKVSKRIVETVDLKCGKHEGDWSMIPLGNQLRRLSFSKISD